MMDLWKAGNGQHYLGIILSFITDDWVPHIVCLGIKPIDVKVFLSLLQLSLTRSTLQRISSLR